MIFLAVKLIPSSDSVAEHKIYLESSVEEISRNLRSGVAYYKIDPHTTPPTLNPVTFRKGGSVTMESTEIMCEGECIHTTIRSVV